MSDDVKDMAGNVFVPSVVSDNTADGVNRLESEVARLEGVIQAKDRELAELQRQLEHYKESYRELCEETCQQLATKSAELAEARQEITRLYSRIHDMETESR